MIRLLPTKKNRAMGEDQRATISGGGGGGRRESINQSINQILQTSFCSHLCDGMLPLRKPFHQIHSFIRPPRRRKKKRNPEFSIIPSGAPPCILSSLSSPLLSSPFLSFPFLLPNIIKKRPSWAVAADKSRKEGREVVPIAVPDPPQAGGVKASPKTGKQRPTRNASTVARRATRRASVRKRTESRVGYRPMVQADQPLQLP